MFADLTPKDYLDLAKLAALAGGAYVMLKQLRKDVNGLGKKVRDQRSVDEQRFFATALILLVQTDDRLQRWKIAQELLESNRGTNGS